MPRVHAELADQGVRVGRQRVARLMSAAGLEGMSRRRLASVKNGLSGRDWVSRFGRRWLLSLGIYQLTGTVRYGTAKAWR